MRIVNTLIVLSFATLVAPMGAIGLISLEKAMGEASPALVLAGKKVPKPPPPPPPKPIGGGVQGEQSESDHKGEID